MIYEQILSAYPYDKRALYRLGDIYYNAKNYSKAIDYLSKGTFWGRTKLTGEGWHFHAREFLIAQLLGDCYMGNCQYPEASKWYHEALEILTAGGDIDMIRNIKVKLGMSFGKDSINLSGEALYASGAQGAAVQLFQQVIGESPEHFSALFAYGKALIEHAELADSMPVYLKLLVHDSGTLPFCYDLISQRIRKSAKY